MAVESNTPVLGTPYPTNANNGSNFAQGVADLATYLDGVTPVALNDTISPGVTSAAAAVITGLAVSAAGAVSFSSMGVGTVYAAVSAGKLVRNAIPTGSFSATPSLPASGKFAAVGVDLVVGVWGATASVALSAKGSDQNSAALALANLPSVASGHYRVLNVIIQNSSGTYSLAASQDVRSTVARLTGQTVYSAGSGVNYGTASTSPTIIDATHLSITLPFVAGTPVEIGLDYHYASGNLSTNPAGFIDFLLDGTTELDGREWWHQPSTVSGVATPTSKTIVTRTSSLTTGVHTIQPRFWTDNAAWSFYVYDQPGYYASFWVRQIPEVAI